MSEKKESIDGSSDNDSNLLPKIDHSLHNSSANKWSHKSQKHEAILKLNRTFMSHMG